MTNCKTAPFYRIKLFRNSCCSTYICCSMTPFKHSAGIYVWALLLLILSACRKEQQHFQKVWRIDSHTTDRLNNILFTDANNGFVVGGQRFYSSTILATHDGGNSWVMQSFPQIGKGFYGIAQGTDSALYVCGFDGKFMRSADSGANWKFAQLTEWAPSKDIAFLDTDKIIVIAGISYYNGNIVYTNKAGIDSRVDTFLYELNDIEMVSRSTGYIAGHGVILKTEDSARSWHLQDIKDDDFMSLCSLGANELWTCGYGGSIFHTTDGGAKWERLRNGNDILLKRYYLLDILFKNQEQGWAVGENGVVLSTTDGGKHWSEFNSFTKSALRCIVFTPDGNLMVCGDDGALYKLYVN